jgi:hypothetical protein
MPRVSPRKLVLRAFTWVAQPYVVADELDQGEQALDPPEAARAVRDRPQGRVYGLGPGVGEA